MPLTEATPNSQSSLKYLRKVSAAWSQASHSALMGIIPQNKSSCPRKTSAQAQVMAVKGSQKPYIWIGNRNKNATNAIARPVTSVTRKRKNPYVCVPQLRSRLLPANHNHKKERSVERISGFTRG